MSHLSVQILESSLQTSFPWSSFHVAECSTWFPSLHGIDPATHTNGFTVSQGPKSKLLSERIQMLCLFQELTPDFIKSSWGERSGSASMAARGHPVRMAGRGIPREVGRRRIGDVYVVAFLCCHSQCCSCSLFPGIVIWLPPAHYLGPSSRITSLGKCSLMTLAK